VSHIPQRKEKDCLNCGAIVQGHYCQDCGQENVVPKETFWHMVTHFFYDITHFDSSFFVSIKDLLFKPGFLSKEYMLGRRKKYLHPIRMYVFTSAVFFLLFFSLFSVKDSIKFDGNTILTGTERLRMIAEMESEIKGDSTKKFILERLQALKDTSKPVSKADLLRAAEQLDVTIINFSGRGKKYNSAAAYDSAQQLLPSDKRDGWFMRRLIKKEIEVNIKYGSDPEAGLRKLGDIVLHRLPYMLFVSLPLFALLLKLVYFRRRQFYYADHGVFTIHLYIFSFILLMIVFGLTKLEEVTHARVINFVVFFLFLALLFYLYKAMRNFYGQRRLKTFIKFCIVAFFSLIIMLVLLAVFMFFSAYTL
jgi:hypothetical protein